MIALVDYGAGNLTSVRKAFTAIGADIWTPTTPSEISRASGIVVPGVGHFSATRALTSDWRAAIKTATESGIPMFGICVGLQWLFEGSEEEPGTEGFGAFQGRCFNLGSSGPRDFETSRPLKVPHVGWNSITLPKPSRLMADVKDGSQVYFTHSYAAPVIEDTAAICEYGVAFTAAVERGNVSAVQFHPEKSGDVGLRILDNWLRSLSRSSEGAEAENAF